MAYILSLLGLSLSIFMATEHNYFNMGIMLFMGLFNSMVVLPSTMRNFCRLEKCILALNILAPPNLINILSYEQIEVPPINQIEVQV